MYMLNEILADFNLVVAKVVCQTAKFSGSTVSLYLCELCESVASHINLYVSCYMHYKINEIQNCINRRAHFDGFLQCILYMCIMSLCYRYYTMHIVFMKGI